ncbi:MAG: hypothetical protein LBQ57_06025 [Spirochaetales bacterium]|jgi:hypothetical protein|nr:hypothetical protein [Spirochaetales bacterium]
MTKKRTEAIPWHPAFREAVELELIAYGKALKYEYEYQLTSEPLRIDLVIIRKARNVKIDKNFARIFRKVNLLEYKSPSDYLSVWDFYKVCGYACLYASLNHLDITDMTLTFAASKFPRKLVQYLKETRKHQVEETDSGIYVVSRTIIPVQIIETKKLSEANNLWLRGLTNDLDIQAADSILRASSGKRERIPLGSYLHAVLSANPKIMREVMNMKNGTLTIDDVLREAGYIDRWKEEGKKEGEEKGKLEGKKEGKKEGKLEIAKNLLREGWSVEKIAKTTNLPPDEIQPLCKPRRK